MTHLHRKLTMNKFIGFDIDHKHTLAFLTQAGQPDRYRKLRTASTVRSGMAIPPTRRGLGWIQYPN